VAHFLTTTDDEEIAEVAANYGCPVIKRPPELGRDDSPMVPVVLHALEHAEREQGITFDALVLLQPPAPIRTGADIDAMIDRLGADPPVDCVISVCPMDDVHPARMYRLDGDGVMESLWPEGETAQRQDLPVVYYRNGALYVFRRGLLVNQGVVMGGRRAAHIMPRERLANIDDERDAIITDVLVQLWKDGRL
jgi:CMP-N-acetylneuraminic acid synthetase